jgi:2-desacetyl-2-hydroxyethyl bacteriochlorophyllide A dehydrogenase
LPLCTKFHGDSAFEKTQLPRPADYQRDKTMTKSCVCIKPGLLEYSRTRLPTLTKGHAILKIKRIGICGTDIHAFEGTQPFFNYPRVLGHEIAADLIEADGATEFTPGQRVSCIPYFSCGHCIACRTGKPNCCVQIEVMGVHRDGGLTGYVSVPSTSLLRAEGLGYDELALLEPLAIGAHAVGRASLKKDELVLVCGAGPIGLAIVDFAHLAGAKVIVLDINPRRLQFCRDHFKAEYLINPQEGEVSEQLKEITAGDMASVVFDATGNLKAINQAFSYLAHGARYVLVGLQKAEISFSHPEFHKREAALMSSRNATRADFDSVIEAIEKKQISPLTYITHRIWFDDLKEKFSSLLDPVQGVIKTMVQWRGDS